ncbi:MAG: CBS domain-containing protein [Chloroflexi bacterium]|nr:MAG: CBS domain-containing protein [Chloroflexota bacterium]
MLVKDYMIKHPSMAEPKMSVVEAQQYMTENNLRYLPVVGDGKRLVGLLTPQAMLIDPRRMASLDIWEITRLLSDLKVKDVMVKARDVITIDPDTPIEQAAMVMVKNRVGCLPVVSEGIVVGLITESDLLSHLANLMAGQISGVRVTVRMPNIRGELAKLVMTIAQHGWGIETMGGAFSQKDPNKWDAVVKIRAAKADVVAALGTIEGQEIIDAREV